MLEAIVDDRLDVRAILVDCDEVSDSEGKGRAHLFRIRDSTRRLLRAGYRFAHSTPMFKRLFVRAAHRIDECRATEPLTPVPAAGRAALARRRSHFLQVARTFGTVSTMFDRCPPFALSSSAM